MIKPDLYRLSLQGRIPVLTAASPTRVWFIDAKNGLGSVDMATGEIYTFVPLPRDAEITALAVGATSVYAADGKTGRLFAFDIATERLASRQLPFLHGGIVMTVAPDGRLWLGMDDSAQLLSFDPITNRTEVVDTQMSGVVAIAIDNFARVWSSDGKRTLGSYDLRTGKVTQVPFPGTGAARALLPDPSGSIWLGTTAGEVFSVRDGVPSLVAMTGRPISRLALDTVGVAWYLTPSSSGPGFIFGAIASSADPRVIEGPAASLDFSIARAAWIADPSGGFYVAPEASK
jgi:streptogramin lyase